MAFTVSTLAREPMIPAIPHMLEVYATRRETVAICRRFV